MVAPEMWATRWMRAAVSSSSAALITSPRRRSMVTPGASAAWCRVLSVMPSSPHTREPA
ncbi:hypothetical protein O984_09435 [Mycobacterium avium 05-4293]|nr:hypothetical protein O984_09435 [Mycobacterium avium 05-4293]